METEKWLGTDCEESFPYGVKGYGLLFVSSRELLEASDQEVAYSDPYIRTIQVIAV